ncbi:hypothetical protein [Butyrivibrio virus Ceridwen]|nr:hypothetical protein [Butyrivibrio virus Ceridwen]
MKNKWIKNNPNDKIWWLDNSADTCGEFVFSFDKKEAFYLYQDYPYKLTKEQKAVFDAENPHWVAFFMDRQLEGAII